MIARLIDGEGVTWREIEVERVRPRLLIPVAFPYRNYKTAEFNYERTDGGGTLIYRMVGHVDPR